MNKISNLMNHFPLNMNISSMITELPLVLYEKQSVENNNQFVIFMTVIFMTIYFFIQWINHIINLENSNHIINLENEKIKATSNKDSIAIAELIIPIFWALPE